MGSGRDKGAAAVAAAISRAMHSVAVGGVVPKSAAPAALRSQQRGKVEKRTGGGGAVKRKHPGGKDLSLLLQQQQQQQQQAPQQHFQQLNNDYEYLLASLTDACDVPETQAAVGSIQPKVNYYKYAKDQQPPQQQESSQQQSENISSAVEEKPRLLIRQVYKLVTEACVVVGLEWDNCQAAIYFTNEASNVRLTFEDLIAIQSVNVSSVVDRYFGNTKNNYFQPFYLNSLVIEVDEDGGDGGSISLCNFTAKSCSPIITAENVVKHESRRLTLHQDGWSALKRLFASIETYYSICVGCTPVAQYLMARYSRYLSRHYRAYALLSASSSGAAALSQDLIRYVKSDLPLFMQNLTVKRLPVDIRSDFWFDNDASSTPHSVLMPWIDAEVRRYCVPLITDSVLDNLKYVGKW